MPGTPPTPGPGPSFARFTNLVQIGAGGMGRVYRAHDPTLGRAVALKLIHHDEPRLAQRLLQEARAQARVEHPHVCRIYEAGEHQGRPYIAMQLVEGGTLKSLRGQLNVESAVRLMKQVAEGVHAAHRVGLIHRDLKPSNVLVERTEDGDLLPYVVDFGLARELDAPEATASGVLGTPFYMSPEQAQGDGRGVDRRSDVYGLGATLYDVLAGRPPFEGDSSIGVLLKVIGEEPQPLGQLNASVPADVQTIVMKCLEKAPGRRYDSARALADDLGRYLDGEPIAARPALPLRRLLRRAQRHAALLSTIALALLAIAGALGLALRERLAAARRATLAAEFARIVEQADWRLRAAHLAPLHDLRPEQTAVRTLLARVRERMTELGPEAQGPGEYALGRGALGLGETATARAHLERAWQLGERGPEVAYALGLALTDQYRQELAVAASLGSAELREARRRTLGKELRDPALAYLRQTGGGDAQPEYVRALVAFHEGHPDEALQRAARARAQDPGLYQADLLRGEVEITRSRELHETGDAAGARQALEQAEAAYQAGADYARSDPEAREGLCQAQLQRLETLVYASPDLDAAHREAVAVCERAVQVDPGRAEPYAKLANIHRFQARSLMARSQNPREALDAAVAAARQALALDPGERRALGNLGIVQRMRAEWMSDRGEDGGPALSEAVQALEEVARRFPDASAHNDLGNALVTRALAEAAAGRDPRPDLRSATLHYDEALRQVPELGYAHANLGIACLEQAKADLARGLDPDPGLARAVSSMERALPLMHRAAGLLATLAEAHLARAEVLLLRGLDPAPALAGARAALDGIPEKQRRSEVALSGQIALLQARWRVEQRQSPAAELAEARRYFGAAATADAAVVTPRLRLAQADLLEARWQVESGADPTTALDRAGPQLEQAWKQDPRAAEARLGEAELCRWRAAWEIAHGRPATSQLEPGLKAAREARRLSPALAESLVLEGALQRLGGQKEEAARSLDAALAANANLRRLVEAERARLSR
jgi:serine/threonine-protein kinase